MCRIATLNGKLSTDLNVDQSPKRVYIFGQRIHPRGCVVLRVATLAANIRHVLTLIFLSNGAYIPGQSGK